MSSLLRKADGAFWRGLAKRATGGGSVLLLERWARGAGMRSWYLLQGESEVSQVRQQVQPGSSITAYFDPAHIAGPRDTVFERAAHQLVRSLSKNEEAVGLDRGRNSPLANAEYISNVPELEAWLSETKGQWSWLGRYPDWLPDGEDALTVVVADSDGVFRDHPY